MSKNPTGWSTTRRRGAQSGRTYSSHGSLSTRPPCPRNDFGPQPQPTLLVGELNHRVGKIGVALRIGRDAVLVAQTEQFRHLTHIYEVIDVNSSTHVCSLRRSTRPIP